MNTQEMIEAIRANYPPENYSELRYALEHCLALLEAEAEGRLIVLPCKVGDTVFWVVNLNDPESIVRDEVVDIIIEANGVVRLVLPNLSVEPTITNEHLFFTRAKAEAVLKEVDNAR